MERIEQETAEGRSAKENPGFLMLRTGGGQPPERAGVLVSGTARGGTSFVASVLARLGLPMGQHPPKFENPVLRACLESQDWERAALAVADLDAQHTRWGFKMAGLHLYFDRLVPLLSQPRVVLVYRDPFACALRKKAMKGGLDIFEQVGFNLDEYRRMGELTRSLTCPVLLLSYEKAALDVAGAAAALARFTGLPMPDGRLVRQVHRDQERYLRSTRADFGFVDLPAVD